MAHGVLRLGGLQIKYAVVSGTSRRYTYFRFRPDKTLLVVVPRGRKVDLDSALRSRSDWIFRQYVELTRNRRILGEDEVMFDGNLLKIVFEEDGEVEELTPDPTGGVVVVRAGDRTRTGELIRRWFLKETSRYVVKKLSSFAPEMLPAKFRRADVREMKSWGYCTRSGRLAFSWQLIALPERLRDYVIFHEISHLSHLNHSSAFKRRLAALCPDFRAREKELNQFVPI